MADCGSCFDNQVCCQDNAGYFYCCDTYSFYRRWWFWFVWVVIFLIGLSCFIGCYRSCKRRQQARYMILPGHQSGYGSVVVTSNSQMTSGYSATPIANTGYGFVPCRAVPPVGPVTPVAPPPYAGYPQEKPPEYTPSAPHP